MIRLLEPLLLLQRRALFGCILSSLSLTPLALAAPQNDFDGDQVSDYTAVSTSGSSLTWLSTGSQSAQHDVDQSFGASTDVPVLGHWTDTEEPTLATVRVEPGTGDLSWQIPGGDGRVISETLGKAGDLIIAGADFDGNGITDAAVMRIVRKKFRWQIRLNMFTEDNEITKISFGKAGDRAFFCDPGSGHDLLGVFGLSGKRQAEARLREVASSSKQRFRGFPRALAKGARPRPIPIHTTSGADLLAFATDDSSDTTIRVFNLQAEEQNKVTISGTGTLFIGDYTPAASSEQIALQTDTQLNLYNIAADTLAQTSKISGTPVDEINIVQTTKQ